MSDHPAAVIRSVCERADALAASPVWGAEQRPFVQHIRQIAHQLAARLQPVPSGELALLQIIPTLDDSYEQSLVALYGYARMLLDHPASFGDHHVPAPLRHDLQRIYDDGVLLARQVDRLRQKAREQRLAQRNAPPAVVDVIALIEEHEAIWRYWLRDEAITLTIDAQSAPPVLANAYHLADLLRHVLVTMATELVEYGHLRLTVRADEERVGVEMFCTGTMLDGTALQTLFGQHGRDLYLQKLQEQNGSIACRRVKGSGAAVQVWLPRSPA